MVRAEWSSHPGRYPCIPASFDIGRRRVLSAHSSEGATRRGGFNDALEKVAIGADAAYTASDKFGLEMKVLLDVTASALTSLLHDNCNNHVSFSDVMVFGSVRIARKATCWQQFQVLPLVRSLPKKDIILKVLGSRPVVGFARAVNASWN